MSEQQDTTTLTNDDTGGGGGESTHWSDELPESYRESFKSYESFDALQGALKGPEIPETYVLPEGVEIDQEVFDAFAPIAKEMKMSQAQVDALIKFDAERSQSLPDKLLQAAEDQMEEGLAKMQSELGKEKYDAAVAGAKRVVKAFGDDATKQWMEETRMGNHPVLIAFLSKIGEALSEDRLGGDGDASSPPAERSAKTMYPNSNHA